ncbi:hypothetical protein PBY51_001571 [Eleginops maclovinus]|uniref:Uncharacterized protein n=1 Tax=Eleginops maclovinus TaxID=56733 RepID=A0AAN7WYM8_ELEMC|nr:hypothetical protein PBY51_001571 [Eleginops maclovinus]
MLAAPPAPLHVLKVKQLLQLNLHQQGHLCLCSWIKEPPRCKGQGPGDRAPHGLNGGLPVAPKGWAASVGLTQVRWPLHRPHTHCRSKGQPPGPEEPTVDVQHEEVNMPVSSDR